MRLLFDHVLNRLGIAPQPTFLKNFASMHSYTPTKVVDEHFCIAGEIFIDNFVGKEFAVSTVNRIVSRCLLRETRNFPCAKSLMYTHNGVKIYRSPYKNKKVETSKQNICNNNNNNNNKKCRPPIVATNPIWD